MPSPIREQGEQPQTGAADNDDAVLVQSAYPGLSPSGPRQLVVLRLEVSGAWNAEAQCFLRGLVTCRH